MIRRIIHIDEEKCSGCGACADACHEGAIRMVDGKARLIRDDYCDGLGDCLPACPADAISFVEREAAPYDEKAVAAHLQAAKAPAVATPSEPAVPPEGGAPAAGGCPGRRMHLFSRGRTPAPAAPQGTAESQLQQWPCQIKLAAVNAPYFRDAELLLAADCTAFAYAGLHSDFMRGRITLIGCPKLDSVDYSEKLTQILRNNSIRSVTVVRMEVPCCGGLEMAAKKALKASGKFLPWQVVTLSIDGKILG